MSKFNELVTKLREIFQIDRPELDFGLYRIINARADEINEYLEKRLKEKVEQALRTGNAANIEQLKEELKKAEQGAQALGVPADSVPKVQELKAKITQASSGNAEHENAVFSHLLTFLSRYYDNGDFISQRRYKGDTYAIPYAGEEVMLHWANKDQYYTKSGENFSNYSFKLEDGRLVHFRLVAADTAKDNRKDNDKERRFVLAEQKVTTRIDDEGDEYEDEILPVEEVVKTDAEGNETKELIIRFEYKAMPKGSKQDKLVEAAVSAVLANGAMVSRWQGLSKREPTEKKPKRTLLEKHLTNYTTKNTADYFIHKNLGKFLRGELDFYIKNEVMHLDDVQNAEIFSDIEKNLRMIQCLRSIALDLIKFLAQLEDFQKKLWTKKKFVVSSHYCITLDRVPEVLYPAIVANEKQWQQWREIGVWDSKKNGTIENLKERKFLMLDTSLFDAEFSSMVLRGFENIENEISGLIINGDNVNALNLISPVISNKVSNIFIDPPYNTGEDGFSYKDKYQTSSWLSMIEQRLDVGMLTLSDDGVMFITIGDEEYESIASLVREKYGKNRFFSTLIWEKKKKGSFLSGNVAKMKDYVLCISKNTEKFNGLIGQIATNTETYPCVNASNPREIRRIQPGIASKYKDPDFTLPKGSIISAGKMDLVLHSDMVVSEGVLKAELVIEGNWRYSQDSMTEYGIRNELYITQDRYLRRIVNEPRNKRMKDICFRLGTDGEADFKSIDLSNLNSSGWGTNEDANEELFNLFGFQYASTYPKPVKLVTMMSAASRHKSGYWMDYFAGSGTTAHAIINLNRLDKEARKYILVEQGDYFNSIIKPRIQKAVFSSEWESGKPSSNQTGISHFLKVLKLESYEDALNNLELKKPKVDLFDNNPELKDDYLLNYMLDVESRGSLLSTDDFRKPFDYTMKIALDSAGAFEEQKVDLVETFNYLIGLTVNHIDAQPERGFVTVTGTLPSSQTCLVLWRDCEKIDYEGLNKLCDKLALNPADNEFDVVYINGDHNIPTVLTRTAEEGSETRVLKLRQIEPEFLELMFAEEEI